MIYEEYYYKIIIVFELKYSYLLIIILIVIARKWIIQTGTTTAYYFASLYTKVFLDSHEDSFRVESTCSHWKGKFECSGMMYIIKARQNQLWILKPYNKA